MTQSPDYATLLAEYSESPDKLFRLEWESGENEFYIAKLEKEMASVLQQLREHRK